MTPEEAAAITGTPFRDVPFLARDIEVSPQADGSLIVRSRVPLGERAPHWPWLLRRNAEARPDHVWLAQRRGPDRAWLTVTYRQARTLVDAVTQALLDLNLPGRAVMVLSGNSIEHALLEFAAMQARMPYVPVTPAYSLRSSGFPKLRGMVDVIDPAVIFVQDSTQFADALREVAGDQVVISVDGDAEPEQLHWDDLSTTPITPAVDESVDAIDADTVAKYMFTSGSTGEPKAVTVTQRMLTTATASNAMVVDRQREHVETVMVDWLPWSHVAGGTAIFGRVLNDMGTIYLDEGRPTPGEFGPTIENLREISPSNFSSMPVGYTMLVDAMDADPALGAKFFTHMRFAAYSGARLPDDTYLRFQAHAIAHTGRRVPFVSGYGSTETSAACGYVYWPSERAGLIGLPQPGIDIKLVPMDDERYEVRVRSDAVTPGYLGEPSLSEAALDDDGYFRMGDAASFVDPGDVREGLAFAGRVAEEFKLQSGTFVRVTALRVAALDAAAPLVSDVVVAGADRPFIGLLVWPNLEVCRERFDLGDDPRTCEPLREALRAAFAAHNAANPATSRAIRRIVMLNEPPSPEAGEINDKRYVNQRRVLERRADDVARLFAEPLSSDVITIDA